MRQIKQRYSLKIAGWALVPMLVGIGPFALLDVAVQKTNNNENKQIEEALATLYIPAASTVYEPIIATPKESFSLGWAGDIAPDTEATLSDFEDVQYFIKTPDVMLGNFEGVVTDGIINQRRCIPDNTGCWIFRGNTDFISLLKKIGFDGVNLANNHTRDYGIAGEIQTTSFLQEYELPAAQNAELTFMKKNDVMIGLIGVYLHGRTTYDDILPLIQKSHQSADITVVMMHGGEEGAEARHVTNEPEWHKGGYRGNMYELAHLAVDNGADLVFGSGPHVLRGVEQYRDAIIAYSMGNFYGTEFSTNGILAASGMVTVLFDENFNVHMAQLVPISISTDGVPSIDQSRASIAFVNELSAEDFGVNGLQFDENGFWNK